MAIHREELIRIAELARLEVPEEDRDAMCRQLSEVLEFAESLRRLDLEGCEPSVFAPADSPLRDDRPDARRLDAARATAGAPESEDGFFLVPPIVENLEP
ncbi:MAG: Asp-tRNA(Asn)/Glu-tRNA(Gln) amidotransferase subunit GatC [Candidatus Eisenbacteria bacterium]|nr:Asp-tRNA(Asn)/Glu-tRNA(Gln) amidotransferase subunit GatC [Candidatus Eisenbacteria bacterium]